MTLRTTLEQITQAAEQYLDTEHRSEARNIELRRKLNKAILDATMVLRPNKEEK